MFTHSKTNCISFQIIYGCLLNGLANILSYNCAEMFEPDEVAVRKKRSLLIRQFVFEVIFLAENIVLLWFGVFADITPLTDSDTLWWFVIAILIFHYLGLLIKVIYYLWKDVNADLDVLLRKIYHHQACKYIPEGGDQFHWSHSIMS